MSERLEFSIPHINDLPLNAANRSEIHSSNAICKVIAANDIAATATRCYPCLDERKRAFPYSARFIAISRNNVYIYIYIYTRVVKSCGHC